MPAAPAGLPQRGFISCNETDTIALAGETFSDRAAYPGGGPGNDDSTGRMFHSTHQTLCLFEQMRSGRHDIGGRNTRKDDRPTAIAQPLLVFVVPNCAVSRTGGTPSQGVSRPYRIERGCQNRCRLRPLSLDCDSRRSGPGAVAGACSAIAKLRWPFDATSARGRASSEDSDEIGRIHARLTADDVVVALLSRSP